MNVLHPSRAVNTIFQVLKTRFERSCGSPRRGTNCCGGCLTIRSKLFGFVRQSCRGEHFNSRPRTRSTRTCMHNSAICRRTKPPRVRQIRNDFPRNPAPRRASFGAGRLFSISQGMTISHTASAAVASRRDHDARGSETDREAAAYIIAPWSSRFALHDHRLASANRRAMADRLAPDHDRFAAWRMTMPIIPPASVTAVVPPMRSMVVPIPSIIACIPARSAR